jgi:transposase
MNKWYAKSLKNIIWNPVHSVDKYHLFQEANKMIDEVRIINSWLIKMSFIKTEDIWNLVKTNKLKTISKKIKKEDIKAINEISSNKERMMKYKPKAEQRLQIDKEYKNAMWELQSYKEITLDYFLENWYRTLYLTREKNLSEVQKVRINQIFREFDYHWYLVESRTLKEDLMDAIDNLDLGELNRVIWECKISEHYRIQQFWRTLSNWYDWIKGYIENSSSEFKFTNAFTEWMNNSCKVAKRQSYWFKNKDNYFRKLFAKNCFNKI